MMDEGREFVERLRVYLRENPEETPSALSVRAGLDNSAIRSLLAGRAQAPRLSTAMKICAAMGTSIEEFMGSPRNAEERDILRLLSQLPLAQRQRLMGYAEALADEVHQDSPAAVEETPQPRDPS